jgi:galactokinase
MPEPGVRRVAFAPGRVNLIGEHTDHQGGFALPMAVQLGTTVEVVVGGDEVRLRSATEDAEVVLPLSVGDPSLVEPPWGRYVAGVIAAVAPGVGVRGTVTTTLPVGAGLSSSAALEVAVALALGFDGSPRELARACQRAEQRASGVPCGIMDQLASAAGVAGHALLLDCRTDEVTPVSLPDGVEVVAVHSGQARQLSGSAYAKRRAACEAAASEVGPLRDADVDDLDSIGNAEVRRPARHVVTENQRVLDFVAACRTADLAALGPLLAASHASLRDDFEVSTPALDQLVDRLLAIPGVLGARLTGAGFGGCAVALCEAGAGERVVAELGGWLLLPSAGARLLP